MNKKGRYIIAAIMAFVLPAIVGFDPYRMRLLIMLGISTILVTSLRLVFTTGIWHVGQAGFYAIGAYSGHFLMVWVGTPFWAALPIAGMGAALIAWGFGYATLRVKGLYFAILSIAFVEVIRLTIVETIGAGNIIVKTPPPNSIITPLFTIDFDSDIPFYYVMLVLLATSLACLYILENSRLGARLKAIAQSESLAESIGINVMHYEVLAFTISSFFAGMTGAFFACYNVIISPNAFTVWYSITLVIMMIVGGLYNFWGPAIGAAVLVITPTFLPSGAIERMFYAILIIVVLFSLPKGLVSLPEVIRFRVSRSKGDKSSEAEPKIIL